MKFKQKCIKSIPFMIYKNNSSTDLIVNNSGNGGNFLAGGVLSCTTCCEVTSTIVASVDGVVWSVIEMTTGSHMGATTMD